MTETLTVEEETARQARADAVASRDEVGRVVAQVGIDEVFLGYQVRAIEASHRYELTVVEKSRRVGITWAFAGDDAIFAATKAGEGGSDVLYISYSFDMAREYIDAAAGFARAFMGIDAHVGEFMFVDEDPSAPGETREIKAFRIDFASGHVIQALTSRPRSLRGKQGRVRIDEAAFVDNLEELLDAAMALVMWGGSVAVMSTHYGVDNPFNVLVQKVRAGEKGNDATVVRITFRDALADGFYERVCLRKGETPTPEGKEAYTAKIYGLYGDAAGQELDAVPARSAGSWLAFDLIERAERKDLPVKRLSFPDAFAYKPDHIRAAEVLEWCERELKPILEKIGRHGVGYGDDFARSGDLSVIWLLMELQNKAWTTPLVVEMRNVPFKEQLFVRVYILNRLRLWKGKGDANGNGAHTAERLVQIFGASRYEGVKAREDWWRAEGPPLKSRFEDGRIEIPADVDIAADVRSVKVVNGVPAIPVKRETAKGEDASAQAGKVKRHGDAAVALFHASAALREGPIMEVEVHSAGQTGAPGDFYGDSDPFGHGDFAETVNLRGF